MKNNEGSRLSRRSNSEPRHQTSQKRIDEHNNQRQNEQLILRSLGLSSLQGGVREQGREYSQYHQPYQDDIFSQYHQPQLSGRGQRSHYRSYKNIASRDWMQSPRSQYSQIKDHFGGDEHNERGGGSGSLNFETFMREMMLVFYNKK